MLPFTMAGAPPIAGTAGVIGPLPFTVDADSTLPFCAGPAPPAGEEVERLFVAEVGDEFFLVALA